MIKYFCDDCDTIMTLNQSPKETDSGSNWVEYQHEQGFEISHYDQLTGKRTYTHICNDCDIRDDIMRHEHEARDDDYLTNYNNADEIGHYGVNPLDYEK